MPSGPFTSHLVTPPPPARRPAHVLQSLAAASSLVTAKEPISSAAQRLALASSLVTRASLAAVRGHTPDSPRATPELGSHAAGRRSTAGSPALRATGFGSLACSPGGTQALSNIAAGHGCADRRKTALGSRGIDVVLYFSQGRVLLTRIMPITAAAAASPPGPTVHRPSRPLAGPLMSRAMLQRLRAMGSDPRSIGARLYPPPFSRSRCRQPIVNAITPPPPKRSRRSWNLRSRSAGINVHVALETPITMSRNTHAGRCGPAGALSPAAPVVPSTARSRD